MLEPHKTILLNQESAISKLRNKFESIRPMRKVVIVCDDPDATDSSGDEGASKTKVKRFIREVCFPVEDYSQVTKVDESEGSVRGSDYGDKRNPKKKRAAPLINRKSIPITGKYKGVRQRKWGKWAAEIRDPIKQKRIWLGTYSTAEEASKAYENKRMEFKALAINTNFSMLKSLDDANNETVCSVVVSKNGENQKSNDSTVCASENDSGASSVLPVSRTSSSVLELDSLGSRSSGVKLENEDKIVDVVPVDKNVPEKQSADSGDGGLVNNMVLAQKGADIDLAFELESFMEFDDFAPPLDDILGEFDDLPICGFDDGDRPSPLPDFDFDFDFDFEACNEALAWIDEVTTPMNGAPPMMNGAPLDIACP